MNHFERRQWEVKEHHFYPDLLLYHETIMTVGNGLLGIRASFEERYPEDTPAIFLAGIYNRHPTPGVTELVNLPNFLDVRIEINGAMFRLDQGEILGYERTLDLRTAILFRTVLWRSPTGDLVRIQFERFVSLAQPHLVGLQVTVQVLTPGDHVVAVQSGIDTKVVNPDGVDHWEERILAVEPQRVAFLGTTGRGKYQVAIQADLTVSNDVSYAAWEAHNVSHAKLLAQQNELIMITKLVAIHTTRDSKTPSVAAQTTLEMAENAGYSALKQAHENKWAEYWDLCDVQIIGDEIAQHAIRFCIYHTLIAAPQFDEHVSIPAKSLSGFGYKGHVFWDTEIFLIPPLSLTLPDTAGRLLMYRYHNLDGARKKAKDNGYLGAMYPWESADTGEETTPQWVMDEVTGEPVRIWTGDNEQHISTDIAYAVLNHWRWTGDDQWIANYGAEVILDTAIFWASRVEWNAKKDRYELTSQVGPDEYHTNINNSVFTNRMVVWHLQQASELLRWLLQFDPSQHDTLCAELGIDDDQLKIWEAIVNKMYIPRIERGGEVYEQFEGFFDNLESFDLTPYHPKTKSLDQVLGSEKIQQIQAIKQADVVMLMTLLGNELGDQEFLIRNWKTYSPIVDHGSSLSLSIHAWVAARLGLTDDAYDLFIQAARLDLDNLSGNTPDGIHAACCGGMWQAVLFGFCGLQLEDGQPTLHPSLPPHWQQVSFKVHYKGKVYPMLAQQ